MATREKNPRRVRREVMTAFERGFDFDRLDYDKRTRPLRGKAIMYGVSVALALYLCGSAVGYYGWQQQAVSYEVFAKLVWIWMLPATVFGAFTWLISSQRLVYKIREDIRVFMAEREADGGYLWRYSPVIEALLPDDQVAQRLIEESQTDYLLLDPEDYARLIERLRLKLSQEQISTDTATRVYTNLGD